MKRPEFIAICLFTVAMAGCTTSWRIAREREAFLRDPSSAAYSYDGKPLDCGKHRAYLYRYDPDFGDYLLSVVASATDPRVPCTALEYFTYRKPDSAKFEQVIARMNPKLLSEEVNVSCTDCLLVMRLSEYIEELRKAANQ